MVWWMYNNKSNCKVKDWLWFKTLPDVIFQTMNIMYDCNNPDANGYVYHILMKAGVNIFNVDLTKHDQTFFEIVNKAVKSCDKIEEKYLRIYSRPIALSVTVSVKEPYEIDDRVDIIILKDITKTEELLEFRKRNEKFSSIPILLWPSNYRIEDLNELIKRSAGIILERNFLNNDLGEFLHVLKAAKEAFKPVFHVECNVLHDDLSHARTRRILNYSNNIINYGLDGVVIVESVDKTLEEFVQTLVRASELARRNISYNRRYFDCSFQAKIPALPPISCAFGACLAALKCNARAILVLTTSGTTARLLTKTSPPCHIIAVTTHESTARCLHLYRKMFPVHYKKRREESWHAEYEARVGFGSYFGFQIGLFDFEAKLVVVAPFEENIGYCDSFQIISVSDAIKSVKLNTNRVVC